MKCRPGGQHHVVRSGDAKYTQLPDLAINEAVTYRNGEPVHINQRLKGARRRLLDLLLKFRRSATTDAPRMLAECSTGGVAHAGEVAFRADAVDLLDDGRPHEPPGRVTWRAGLTLDAHHRADHITHRRTMAAEEDHGRRSVPGDIGA